MAADIADKDGLLGYEPWKVVIVSAGAGLTVALTALATFILSRL